MPSAHAARRRARSIIEVMSSDERQAAPATDRETHLAADYTLILSGGPGWHLAFKRFRLALGVGQKPVAKWMGIHPTAITKWEHGRSQPSKETRGRALTVIGWTPTPSSPPSEMPTTAPIKEMPQVREKEYLPQGADWEPPRSQPRVERRRPYRASRIFFGDAQRGDEEDPDSPYFISK